jgi:alpha-beta hydrolase superfamily lysophospholipase
MPSRRSHIKRIALVVISVVLVTLAIPLAWLKAHEAELVFRVDQSRTRVNETLPAGFDRISIPAVDGTLLAANIIRAATDHDNGLWIVHLHGNSETAFSNTQYEHAQVLQRLGFSVLGLDYRGFGLTPGKASENAIYQDATAAYEFLKHQGIDDAHIVLWGHSLGSGPAVYLAQNHPAKALVLFGAFTSIPDAAADTYPHLPVKAIAAVQFNSRERLRDLHLPILIAHSTADRVILYHHAEELFAAANPPKKLLSLKPIRDDGLGGHQHALYDQPMLMASALTELLGIAITYK